VIEHLCLAHSKLKALSSHVLNQNRQVKLAAAGHLKAVRGICLLHSQAHVCVQLSEQPLTDVAGSNVLALQSGQRAVVYHEVHGNGRLGNLLERNGLRLFRRTDGISDVDVGNSGNSYNRADSGL